jgi:transcriptional regulator with XRE-family HTH domain
MVASTKTSAVPRFEVRHRLQLALEHADVSVGEMADELGVHRNTIGRYLHASKPPSRAVLRVWAMRCGVPFAWLETGESDNGGGDGPGQSLNTSAATAGYTRHLRVAA